MQTVDLDTPSLVVDLDVLERNIAGMASMCAEVGIVQRVHRRVRRHSREQADKSVSQRRLYPLDNV